MHVLRNTIQPHQFPCAYLWVVHILKLRLRLRVGSFTL